LKFSDITSIASVIACRAFLSRAIASRTAGLRQSPPRS
jgi:hypothetical protein